MLSILSIIINTLIIIFYIITLFFLFEIKVRVYGKISMSFFYFIIAIIILILLRVLDVLDRLGLVSSLKYNEFFVLIFSLFLLLAFIEFYRDLRKITDGVHNPDESAGGKDKSPEKKKNFQKPNEQNKISKSKEKKIEKKARKFEGSLVGGYLDLTKNK